MASDNTLPKPEEMASLDDRQRATAEQTAAGLVRMFPHLHVRDGQLWSHPANPATGRRPQERAMFADMAKIAGLPAKAGGAAIMLLTAIYAAQAEAEYGPRNFLGKPI